MQMRFVSGIVWLCWFAAACALAAEVPSPVVARAAVQLRDYRVQVQAVNEQQAQLNFDAVFFGIEAFAKPIPITPDSPLVTQNPKGLIAFIVSLLAAFQNFSDPAGLESYLMVEGVALDTPLGGQRDLIERLVQQHKHVAHFELYCGWFFTPTDFLAVLKLVQTDGTAVYSPTLFTLRSAEWKLLLATPERQLRFGLAIALALENPRRFQMRYRNALPEEGAVMPAANWRSFF